MPLAVLGMLLAMLFMAAVLQRYQAHQAAVRAQLRHLERGVMTLETALQQLHGVALSRELRLTLRGDALARYRRIAALFRRYPGIAARIHDAEVALNAEGATAASGVGPLADEQAFRQVTHALDNLIHIIDSGETLRPVPRDVRQIFRRELGERRAEANARYYIVQSEACRRNGDSVRARAHLTTLLQVLKRRGPSTDFVRELYVEAERLLDELLGRNTPPRATSPAEEDVDGVSVMP